MRSNPMRSWKSLAGVILLAGCVEALEPVALEGPTPGAPGRLEVALDAATLPAIAFQVRLFRRMPEDLSEKAYYESPCTALGSGFSVNRLTVGTGYLLMLDAFSSGSCDASTRVGRGVRGDIEILPEGTGRAVYFVQMNRVGEVTEMPLPPPTLTDSGVACTSDADCQGVDPCEDANQADCFQEACLPTEECEGGVKWVRFRVHPAARCVAQVCRLESLFPLNGRWPRAFHAVAAAPGGVVRVLGGIQQADGAVWTASTTASAETFDSRTFLFEEEDLGASPTVAAMATAPVSTGRLLAFGGTPGLGKVALGAGQVPGFSSETCVGAACVVQPIDVAFAVNLETGTVTRSQVDFQGAGGLAMGIPGPGALVRPGVVVGEGNRQTVGREAWRCILGEEDAISCLEFPGSENAVPRLYATVACLSGNRLACTEVVVLGGNVRTAPVAELYQIENNQFTNLVSSGNVPETLYGAVAVEVGGLIWTFGGRLTEAVDAPPYAFNIDPGRGTVSAQAADLSGEELDLLRRIGHQATPLKDGKRVLVTGGMGPNGKVWDQAVLLSAEGSVLKVLRVVPMAPRAYHQAVVLEGGWFDGAVVLTGGIRSFQGSGSFAGAAALFLP